MLLSGLQLVASAYTDSSSDAEDDVVLDLPLPTKPTPTAKRQKTQHQQRLPLPEVVLGLYNKDEDKNDTSEMHGGRVRSFAHVRGNWATYIFVPVTVDKHLGNLVSKLVKAAREFTGSDWQCVDDFHISVSRTVVLAHHCIEPFTDSIKTQLEFVKSFIITFEGVELYTNDEKTRSFLGLKVGFGHSDLCNIIAHTDAVMQDFHLTKFYLQPSFHMSVGWCVGDLTESVAAETITCFNKLMLGQQRDHGDSFTMLVSEFRCKTGNRVYVYPLDDS